jgi:recombinational DNA repair protein RecT
MTKLVEQKTQTQLLLEKNKDNFIQLGLSKHKLNVFLTLAEQDFKINICKKIDDINIKKQLFTQYCNLLKIMARLDLTPELVNPKAYIINRNNILNLQIGWRGYLDVANKSGYNFTINIVYKDDIVDIDLANNTISHKPSLVDSEMIAVYCIARKDGKQFIELMKKKEIDSIRDNFGGGNSVAWKNSYEEMAKKTILKRAIKRLDTSNKELEIIDEVDNGLGYDNVVDVEVLSKSIEVKQQSINEDAENNRALDNIIQNETNEDGVF